MFKKAVKKLMPPIVFDLMNSITKPNKNGIADVNINLFWQGNYKTWEDAEANSVGYDADIIFKKTAESILKVKSGQAVFERDSVLLDKPEYSWPLLAILQKIAIEKNVELNIVDFGGSLGSSYFQNKAFLNSIKKLKWSVVEQEHYIQYGNDKIADENLKFYFNIEDCIKERNPPTLLLSGVIQCIDKPYDWLKEFMAQNFEYIIFDRTAFIDNDEDRLTVQMVPESIYKASYPAWFFNMSNILNLLSSKYDLVLDFNSGFTPDIFLDGKRAYWHGLFFKRKI